ncbi:MAG: sigma-70 family RNA polymerase sigma factor [Bacteroidota bacterium]
MSKSTTSKQLDEKLFRRSYAKTVAVLVKYFGLDEVETAEDIVQETLVEAFERWSVQGWPDHPEAWIMDVAKKKTINLLRRNRIFRDKILPQLERVEPASEAELQDSTLKMIFACCHPELPKGSQIALALKTLCGLSVPEIARALLTSTKTINKRLYRAKEKFRTAQIPFVIPDPSEFDHRLDSVCKTLYLLFNEGYYAPHHQEIIRADVCFEAVRLLKEVSARYDQSRSTSTLRAH